MIDNMTHGGRIALLGTPSTDITLDFSKIIFNMITIQGVTGRQIFETWYTMASSSVPVWTSPESSPTDIPSWNSGKPLTSQARATAARLS